MRGFSTKCIHAGKIDVKGACPHVVPIYQTVNFDYGSAEEARLILTGEKKGYVYSRLSNPTVDALCFKVKALEEGESCLSFSSGMAAISSSIVSVTNAGDHIVASDKIYGGTHDFITNHLCKMGVTVSFVDTTKMENVRGAIRENTKLVYAEPLSNPTLGVTDIGGLSAVCREKGILLIVDNTFTPPPLFSPLKAGADVVCHSATKYLSGHGDVIGGVVVGKKEYVERLSETMKCYGGTLSPSSAWLVLRGIKTLALRMGRHCENAFAIARFLASQKKVERVFYPGLESHPGHKLAKRMFSAFGGMLSFKLKGGDEAGKRMMNSLRLCKITVSLGDVETLLIHPSISSHSSLSEEERRGAGIEEGLIRMSVGIEDAEDIIEDLNQALDKA